MQTRIIEFIRRIRTGIIWLIEKWRSIEWPEIPLTPLQWVLLFFIIFALIYSWSTPIFESHDEFQQFGYVELVRVAGELPVQIVGRETPWGQVGSNPPLYYMLAGAVISPLDISDVSTFREVNPYANTGDPSAVGNKNFILHETVHPFLTGTPLAVHLLRVLNIAVGLITIWMGYQIGLLVAPKRPVVSVLTAVLIGFNPMFIFVSASVSSLPLEIAFNAVAIYLVLRLLRDGFDWLKIVGVALLLGASILTGLSAVVLIPVIVVYVALIIGYKRKRWRDFAIIALSIVVISVVVAGWWYIRNLELYGEVFGTITKQAIATEQANFNTGFNQFDAGFEGYRTSYWGLFGVFNIKVSGLFYLLIDFVLLLGGFGLILLILELFAIRDFGYARRELVSTLFLFVILIVANLVAIVLLAPVAGLTGTLVFPYMAALIPLLAVGLVEVIWWLVFVLTPPDRSFVRAGDAVPDPILRRIVYLPSQIFGVLAFVIPLTVLIPIYAKPAPIDTVPANARSAYVDFGNMELVGYEVRDRRYIGGELIPMTLYWRVKETSEVDQNISIGLVDDHDREIGKLDSFPGSGKLRTTEWEADKIYPDETYVRLDRSVVGRFPLRMQIGWRDYETQTVQTALDANGESISAVVDVGAFIGFDSLGTQDFVSLPDVTIEFGGLVRLVDFTFIPKDESSEEAGPDQMLIQDESSEEAEPDQMLIQDESREEPEPDQVLIQWETVFPFNDDYASFLHIINDDGEIIGQSDVAPRLPTRYWRTGDTFVVTYPIVFAENLEPGRYDALIGWYNLDTLSRLEVASAPFAANVVATFEFDDLADEEILDATEEFVSTTAEAEAVTDAEPSEDEISDFYVFLPIVVNDDGTVDVPQIKTLREAQQEATVEPVPEAEIAPSPESNAEDDILDEVE